jgi:chemotaxis protein MotB
MADNDSAPIIIKKVNKGHGGHHGGAWKVAYADFVTAMMALFIVLWVLSQNDEVIQGVAGYFQDPIGFSNNSTQIIDGPGSGTQEVTIDVERKLREMERERLAEMGQEIVNEISSNEEFVHLANQIEIEFVDEGMRIEMVESAEHVFFQIGSSNMQPESKKILRDIGSQLAKINNLIVVEGHTDARPFVSAGEDYSNYELSADRANAARRELIAGGLHSDRVYEIRGYADKMLRDEQDPFNVVNRRISIIVKFTKNER